MLNWFLKKINNRKGFTLIELIVVIAILGILALIAIPRFSGMTERAEVQARTSMATTILNAAEVAATELNTTSISAITDVTIPNLITDDYLRNFDNTDPVYTLTHVSGTEFTVSVPHPDGTSEDITVGN